MKRRAKHIVTFCMLLCMSGGIFAQHSGLMSQYMFNGLLINPAYAGSLNTLAINVNYRTQWTGFEGAPASQALTIHGPFTNNKLAFGGLITREEVGVSTEIAARGVIAYRLKLDKAKLRFGLGGGVGVMNSRWSDVVTDELDDPLFATDAPATIRPIVSAGVFYEQNNFYAGYSLPALMRYEFQSPEEVKSQFSLGQAEHIFTAGYVHKYNRYVVIKSSFLFRANPTTGAQVDINTNVIFKNKIWTGLSYRLNESVIALLEYQLNHQLRIGYSYDYGLGEISRYSAGSHEIMLTWVFSKQSFARTPRYF